MAQIARTATVSIRKRLLLGTALAMLTATPAYAQVSGMTGASAQSNGSAPTFNNGTPGKTAITLNGSRTIIDWDSFNIASTETATYYFQNGKDIVLNRVKTGSANIDGTVEGRVGTPASSQYGGNIWILARDGVIFGANARISTGGLLASTATAIDGGDAAFLGTGDNFTTGLSGAADGTKVEVLNGAQIRGYGGALAFIAPEVTTAAGSHIGKGTLAGTAQSPVPTTTDIASTQVLYGAANRFTVQFAPEAGNDLSLVKFAVPDTASGSVAATPLSIAGSTDAGDIYLAAVSRAGVINATIDITGTLVATRSSTVGGIIVLGSGGNTGLVETAADGSDVDLRLTGAITGGTSIGAKVSGDFTSTGTISLSAPFDAGGTKIEAGGAISVTDITSTGGASLDLIGTSVTAGILTGAHDVYVEARNGSINVARVNAGDDILMKASQGGITLGAAVLTGLSNVTDVPIASRGDTGGSGHRQLYLNARDKITLGAASPAAITAANILSMGGSTRNGTLISGGDIEINLGSSGSGTPKFNTLNAGNGAADIRVNAPISLSFGQLTARDISIDLGINSIDIESAADVRRDYTVRAGLYLQNSLNPALANLRDLSVTITGASMSFGSFSLTAGRNLTVIAEATASNNIGFNNLTALTGDVTFIAAKDIYNAGSVTAQGNITIQSLTGGIRVVKDVIATTGNLSLLSADNGNNTTSSVDGLVKIGGSDYTLRGGEMSGFGNTLKPIFTGSGPVNFNIIDTAGGLTLPASINVTGNLNITVQGANNTFSTGSYTLTAGGNMSLTANNLALSTRPTIGGNYSVTAATFTGSVFNPIFTNAGNNFSIVDTAGGLDLGTTNLAAPGTLSIEVQGAGANLIVNGASAGGDMILKAGGLLNMKQAASVTGNYSVTAQDFTGFAFRPTGMAAASDFTIIDTAGGLALGTLSVGGTLNVRAENGDLTITGPISSANEDIALSTTGGGSIALNGDVTTGATRSVALNAAGNITQTGMIDTGTLTGTATGSAMLTGANRITTLGNFSANGFSLNDSAGGLLVSGNVSAGTGTARIVTVGNIGLGVASQVSGREVILSATGVLDNAAGAGAIAASDRWLVYLGSHTGNNFNNLDSGSTAIWNAALANKDPGTISGTHYVFNYLPTLTFRSLNLSKTYGQALDLSAPVAGTHYAISGLLTSVAGAYQGDTLSSVLSGLPSLASLGAGAQAGVVGGGYGITIGMGSLQSLTGYALQFDGSGILTVNRKVLSATATVQNKVYDGQRDAQGSFQLNGVEAWDAGNLGAEGSFRFQNKDAGTRGVDALFALTGAAAGNYDLVLPTGLVAEIFRKKLTLSFDAQNRVYDGTVAATGVARGLNGVVGSEAVGSQNLVFEFDGKDAGNRRVRLVSGNLAGDAAVIANYELDIAGTGAVDALIARKGVTIDFSPRNKTYDGLPGAIADVLAILGLVGAESVDLLSPSFAFADHNAGTRLVRMTGGTLGGAAAGNYYIDFANMGGIAATIARKGVTFDFLVSPRQYNGTRNANALITAINGILGVDSGLVGLDNLLFQYAGKDVGNHVVSLASGALSGAAAGNYFIDFASQGTVLGRIDPRILTVNASVATRQYNGGVDASGTLTLDNVVAGEEGLVSIGGATFLFRDKNASASAKPVDITGGALTGSGSGNYTVVIPTATTGFITRKALNVSATVSDKTYDGTVSAAGTYSYDGIIAGDVLTVAGGQLEFENKNAGRNKSVFLRDAVLGGADAGNYEVSFTASAGTASITPKGITATATADNKVYNRSTAGSGRFNLSGIEDIDLGKVSVEGATFTFDTKDVGTGKLVTITGGNLAGSEAGNYTVTLPVSALASITKASLNVSAAVSDKVYDGTTNASGTYVYDGIYAGDVLTVVGGQLEFENKNAGRNKNVFLRNAVLGGADAGNYEVSFTASAGTASITPKALGVTASANDKTYDGTTSASGSFSLSGVEAIDAGKVSVEGATFTFETRNAGTGKTVTITGGGLAGSEAGNYSVTLPVSVLASITRKVITATASANDKAYDGTTSASGSFSLSGVEAIDAGKVTVEGATFTFDTRNAGTGKTVTITGGGLAGSEAGNYSITLPVSALASITRKVLTATATANDKTYDGTTSASGSFSLSGVEAIDAGKVTVEGATFTFETRNAGTGKTVTITGGGLAGSEAGNYALTMPVSALANITRKVITATASTNDKTYDGTTSASGSFSLSGVEAIDAGKVSVEGATFTFETRNAGTGKTVTITGGGLAGSEAGNYSVTLPVSALASITRKVITATASANDKVYDGTTSASGSFSLSGVEAIDAGKVTVEGATFTFDTRNAGAGKTVTITGGGLAGPEAGNYSITLPISALASITRKVLTATATANNKVYDGTTAATGSVQVTGFVQGDAVGYSGGVFTFADRNAGTNKSVSVTGLSLTGADAGNYELRMPQGVFASIARRSLSINANNATKEQRQSDPALTYLLTQGDLVAGDQLTGGLTRERGEGIGRYGILQGTLTAGSNYDITFTPGVFSITSPTGLDEPLPIEPTSALLSFVQNQAQVPNLAPREDGLVVVDKGIGCDPEDRACTETTPKP